MRVCGVKRGYLTPLARVSYCAVVTDDNVRKPKRQIGPRVDDDVIKDIRILAIRQERRVNELIDEALRDLLKKYREKSKGK